MTIARSCWKLSNRKELEKGEGDDSSRLRGAFKLNELEYSNFYEKVGKINGWDFSELQITSEGVEWDFYEEVLKRAKETDVLLDIGTGGGEHLLTIASSLRLAIGIDSSIEMVKTAEDKLRKSLVSNLRLFQMNADELLFPPRYFDLVSSRHAPFNASEIAKVLKGGGIFLTQQVSEADKLNLKIAFNRGQSFEEADGSLKEQYMKELKQAGFTEIQSFDYNATDYYQRPEDLIFLLTHTPIIPNFGQDKKDLDILNKFIKSNQTNQGIATNSKRFLIIAHR